MLAKNPKQNKNKDEKLKIVSHAHKTRAHRFVKKNKTCRLCLSKKGAKYTCYLIYNKNSHSFELKFNANQWKFLTKYYRIWMIFPINLPYFLRKFDSIDRNTYIFQVQNSIFR